MRKYFSWVLLAMIGYGLIAFAIYGSASKQVAIFNQKHNTEYSASEWIWAKESINDTVTKINVSEKQSIIIETQEEE
jgi:hypothetical protein